MRLLTATIGIMLTVNAAIGATDQPFGDLYGRTVHLAADTSGSAQEMISQALASGNTNPAILSSAHCLERLGLAIGTLSDELHALTISENLRALAVNKFDKESALEISKLTVSEMSGIIPHVRNQASQAQGDCPQNMLVMTKAQELLGILSDADEKSSAFQARYGKSKYWVR